MSGDSTLLERNRERTILATAVDAALDGDPTVVVVEGPPGIGKTRLLTEARVIASGAGLRVLTARGSPLEDRFAFGVARQLFESVLLTAGAEECARWLSGAAAPAASALAQTPVRGAIPHTVGDLAVLHGLYWLVVNLSQDQPLLLAVDDLQWADAPSLRMLAYLTARLDGLRVMLTVAVRPDDVVDTGRNDAPDPVLDLVLTSHGRVHLAPRPLSADAVSHVATARLSGTGTPADRTTAVDREFTAACHAATGGNPLLLHELLAVAAVEGWSPTADNAGRLLQLGSRAVARHAALRLGRLDAQAQALADAAAVLGDDCGLRHAAALAGLTSAEALHAAGELHRAALLRLPTASAGLSYRHPLIRAAVYQAMPTEDRIATHTRAAGVLADDHEVVAERVAAHLLAVPAAGNRRYGTVLCDAAAAALARGAPDVASTYLRRALAEPLDGPDRLEVLRQAGSTTILVDSEAAARYLEQALDLTSDPLERAEIAIVLGSAHTSRQRYDQAHAVWTAALTGLPGTDHPAAVTLRANCLAMRLVRPPATGGDILDVTAADLRLARRADLPGRQLAGVLACLLGHAGDPVATELAGHAVTTNLLLRTTGPELVCAWNVLVHTDDPRGLASVEAAIADAHQRGATHRLVGALAYRALSRLRRGELVDAETDCRESARLAELSNVNVARAHVGPWLTEVLIEQGRLDEAQAALDWIGAPDRARPDGTPFYTLYAEARLHAARGDHVSAANTARLAGARFAALGGKNPAVLPWLSEAALALHATGDSATAHDLAEQELRRALRCGSATAAGRALRVAGIVNGDLGRLRDAVATLESSPAQLERARAALALGSALHLAGRRSDAVDQLRHAADLAHRCAAHPLLAQVNAEIRACGAKVRPTGHTDGVAGLTDSERRVALLAVQGHRNKDIAQELFVTTKTVEVHLSNVYRKLGITRRQLTTELFS